MDLGEIEITGEVRRPNINLIYSKKYMNKAMALIAKKELKKFEAELLRPTENLVLKRKARRKKKNPGSSSKEKIGRIPLTKRFWKGIRIWRKSFFSGPIFIVAGRIFGIFFLD